MSVVFIDGLDWATTTSGFASGWSAIGQLDSTEGRQGGVAFSGVGDNASIGRRFLSSPIPEGRTFYLGYHMKLSAPGDDGGFDIYFNAYNAAGEAVVTLESNFTGTGRLEFNNGASHDSSDPFPYYSVLSADTYGRFELICNLQAGDLRVQLWINGTKYAEYDNINSTLTDHDIASFAWFASGPTGERVYLDDMVCFDDQGDENVAAFDAPFGPYVIETLLPTSDGTTTAWTPSSAGSNFADVDEADPDGDTTYVGTGTDGNRDLYGFEAAGDARRIYAVEVNAITALDTGSPDAGIRAVAKSGTTTATTNPVTVTSESYALKEASFSLDPDAVSDEWDKTSVDAAEFGIELEETI